MSSFTNHHCVVAVALLSAFGMINAQSVSTIPVGYQTITINGSPDGSTPAFTSVSVGFLKESLYNGSLTSTPTSSVITDTAATLTPDTYDTQDAAGNSAYYVEITSGSNEGLILDITDNTATTITTGSDLTGVLASGDTFAIKAHTTLSDIFGSANSAGLESGGDAASSDLIYVMSTDGTAQYTTYYYQTDELGFLGGTGWRVNGDSSTDMSSVRIAPDDGVFVRRTESGDLSVTVSGHVKDAAHNRVLPAGYSLVAYPFPLNVALSDSGIYTETNGYVTAGDSATSDLVYLIGSTGSFTTYYRQKDDLGFLGGHGWRLVGDAFTSRDAVEIPAGSAVIILHRGSGLSWSDAVPYTL